MKKSAWDNKLWHDKMQQLPVEGDANAAWQKMQGLLDENMPVNSVVSSKPGKFFQSKIVQILGAILVAAIICYVAYYLLNKHPDTNKQKEKSFIPATKNAANKTIAEQKGATAQNVSPAGKQTKPGALVSHAPGNATIGFVKAQTKTGDVNLKQHSAVLGNANSNNVKTQAQTNKNAAAKLAARGDKLAALNDVDAGKNAGHAKKPANNLTVLNKGRVSPGRRHRILVSGNNIFHQIHQIRMQPHQHPNSIINSGPNGRTHTINPQNQSPQKTAADTGAMASAKKYLSAADSAKMGLVNNNKNLAAPASNKPLAGPPAVVTKPAALATNAQNKRVTAAAKSNKNAGYSKFQFGINAGLNTSPNSTGAFAGVLGNYSITPKWGIGIGVNMLPQKLITGGFSNTSYKYIIVDDSGKTTHHIADKLTVQSTRKVYTVDVPVIVSYRLTNFISLKAGPVFGIPVKTGLIKNTLSPFSNPIDTLSAYKDITSAANSTTINNNLNLSLSGGVSINFNRFYIDANYLQGLSPYTISSSLGSSKIYYHYFQFGVGYYLFKSKPKK